MNLAEDPNSEIAKQVVKEVNKFRSFFDVSPLKLNDKMTCAAKVHAYNIANGIEKVEESIDEKNAFFTQWIEYTQAKCHWYVQKWFYDEKDSLFSNEECRATDKFALIINNNLKSIGVGIGYNSGRLVCFVVHLINECPINPLVKKCIKKPSAISMLKSGILDTTYFQKLIMDTHNYLRKCHGAKKLNWSNDLQKIGGNIFDSLKKGTKYDYGTQRAFGVNKWKGTVMPDIFEIIMEWYMTYKSYSYSTVKVITSAVPFCQIVWKETSMIGAYLGKTELEYMLLVVYVVPGNTPTTFNKNVSKPLKKHCTLSEIKEIYATQNINSFEA